ncbi:hypothetical protein GGD56_002519 [Rhizobium mongolense]|uniref:Uncharacterized protein n=2 Tax=Rhizobium mongolense TaxID=57676 RepID=A0ABR6ILD5_9HYPH|nr:hypothetical protein [Rhizobium mongolense]TVZ63732.1 hypothetical protein BCL32_3901 [Rhizobium mongolense USDA 1844]
MALVIVSSAANGFSKGSGYLNGAFHTEILAMPNPAEVFYAGSLKGRSFRQHVSRNPPGTRSRANLVRGD